MKNKKLVLTIVIIILIILFVLAIAQGIMIWNISQEKNNKENISNSNTENTNNENQNSQSTNIEIPSIEEMDKEPATYTVTEDSKRFKQEYEALNNTQVAESGENYNTVNIPEANPIVYVNIEELVNIINSDEEAFIYFSSPTCAYCRATIETLLKALQDLGVQKLYYYDLDTGMTVTDETKRKELLDQLVEKGLISRNSQGNESWTTPLVAKTKSGEVLEKKSGISRNFL